MDSRGPLASRRLRSSWREHRLRFRLLLAIVLASTCFTLLATATQLYLDFRRDLANIEASLDQVQRTYVGSLANSLWTFDTTQIQLQLDGLLQLRDVQFVEVKGSNGERFQAGQPPRGRTISRDFALLQTDPRRPEVGVALGTLTVTVGIGGVYGRLAERGLIILATQAAGTLFLSVFILFIVSRWVTRRLGRLAGFARGLSIEHMGQSVSLQGRPGATADELDDVAAALNDMSRTLASELARRAEVESERARLHEAFERNQDLLQGLIDNTPAIVYVKDLHGKYLLVNRRYDELFGNGRELEGLTDADFFPAEVAAAFRDNDRRVVAAGAAVESEEVAPHDDGLHTYLSLKFPLRGVDGKTFAICGISTDVTERKRLEEQLRQAQKMESVGMLAGGIAHDFNNLLTPILGNSELLLQELTGGTQQELMTEIQQAARRAADLTRQLLAFGRKQVLELERTSLTTVVGHLQGILRRTIREDIRIEVLLSSTLGDVLADAGQIEQVLLNLAINARDAMPRGGTLTIEARDADLDEAYASQHPGVSPGPYVLLAVGDTGTGMDPQTQGRLFEPFFTTKARGKGTGLGLPTVYGIVKQHGGSISVRSVPGRGSTFEVYLPRLPSTVEGDAPRHPSPSLREERARAGESILVVEDNDMVRNTACEMLRRLGYTVLSTDGAEDCYRLAEGHERRIDLLLTDVILVKSNGKEVFERLAASRKGMKVLYMSGYTGDVIARQGVLEEGVHFIQKPLTLQSLSRKVREVLDSP